MYHLFMQWQRRKFHVNWSAWSTPSIKRVYSSMATGFCTSTACAWFRVHFHRLNIESLWILMCRFTCRLSVHEIYVIPSWWTETGGWPTFTFANLMMGNLHEVYHRLQITLNLCLWRPPATYNNCWSRCGGLCLWKVGPCTLQWHEWQLYLYWR